MHVVSTVERKDTFRRIVRKKNRKPSVSTAEKLDTKVQNVPNKEKSATAAVVLTIFR